MSGGRKIIFSFVNFFHFFSFEEINILPWLLADTVLCVAFRTPARNQRGSLNEYYFNLHFLTLLPLAQHGLPHLAKDNSFQLIVNNNRFFCGMSIDISTLHPPKRGRNFVRNKDYDRKEAKHDEAKIVRTLNQSGNHTSLHLCSSLTQTLILTVLDILLRLAF